MSERNTQPSTILLGEGVVYGYDNVDEIYQDIGYESLNKADRTEAFNAEPVSESPVATATAEETASRSRRSSPNHGVNTVTNADRVNEQNTRTAEKGKFKKVAGKVGALLVAGALAAGIYSTVDGKSVKASAATPVAETSKSNEKAIKASEQTDAQKRTQLLRGFANRDTGSDSQGLIGNIDIVHGNNEATMENIKAELRHNPQSLAHAQTYLEALNAAKAGENAYDLASTPEYVARMNERTNTYRDNDNLELKSKVYDSVVEQLESGDVRISYRTVNGQYHTFIANPDGSVRPGVNTRMNDEWVVFTKANGAYAEFRECMQGVKQDKVTTPVKVHIPKKVVRVPVDVITTPPEQPKPEKPKPTPKPPKPPVVIPPPEIPPTPPEQPPKEPPKEEKVDDGKLPGNPNVPADQDKGTPDVAGTAPAVPGPSPAHVPRQEQEPGSLDPAPKVPSSEVENRPPAETGVGPVVVKPEGSAPVEGRDNEEGRGGQTDPGAI